jgi:hypothetical protein
VQDWQRREKPLVKSESLAKTNWQTGKHCDALLHKKNHKFGSKYPSPIPAIAHSFNAHKLHRQDAADPGAAAAVFAAALSMARAGPLGQRRCSEPRTGLGASAPGGRAESGGYDEGASAAVVAAILSSRFDGPGCRAGGTAASPAPVRAHRLARLLDRPLFCMSCSATG